MFTNSELYMEEGKLAWDNATGLLLGQWAQIPIRWPLTEMLS